MRLVISGQVVRYVHHCHRMIVFAQPKFEILEKLGGDPHEIGLAQAELLLDLFEDGARGLWSRPIVKGCAAHRACGNCDCGEITGGKEGGRETWLSSPTPYDIVRSSRAPSAIVPTAFLSSAFLQRSIIPVSSSFQRARPVEPWPGCRSWRGRRVRQCQDPTAVAQLNLHITEAVRVPTSRDQRNCSDIPVAQL